MITFDPSLRKKLAAGSTRAVLDRAFRLRAGFIGAAQSCLCDWPIVRHETASQHAVECPAHHIIESMLRAAERAA